MSSSDKTIVLITGANQGIGFDTAKELATSSDVYHVLVGSRNESNGEKAVAAINALSPASIVSAIQIDVSSADSIKAAVASTESQFGRLDVLINNAGVVSSAADLETQIRQTFDVNVIGAALTTEAFGPLLQKSRSARIVHVTSDLGSISNAANPEHKYHFLIDMPYRMSKAALNMMTTCHTKTFKDDGIKVFAYNPGYVVTNLSGVADRENRIKNGAGSSEGSARGLRAIVEGKRDQDANKLIEQEGVLPW